MLPKTLISIFTLTSSALAHWSYTELIVNDEVVGKPWQYIRHHNNTNVPLTNPNGTEFRCNTDAQPSETYTVKGGDELGFSISETFGHPGIQQVFLSKAPEGVAAADYDGSAGWARIYSLTSVPKNASDEVLTWATHKIHSFRFPLSAATPPGEYLLRTEGLALHAAHKRDTAQFYVSCAQIRVEVGDEEGIVAGELGPLLPIPGMYRGDDPGVLIPEFWSYLTNYSAPGPKLWPEGTLEQHVAKELSA